LINKSSTGELKKIKEIFKIFTKYDQKHRIIKSSLLVKRFKNDTKEEYENDLINSIMNFEGFKKEVTWNKRVIKQYNKNCVNLGDHI
jgi:hypothetical protein